LEKGEDTKKELEPPSEQALIKKGGGGKDVRGW